MPMREMTEMGGVHTASRCQEIASHWGMEKEPEKKKNLI